MPTVAALVRGSAVATIAVGLMIHGASAQMPATTGTIEKLVTDGWEVAGYVAAFENRTLILFKHREHRYLVQCSVLIDVLRNPRTVTVCYELR